MNRLRVFNRHRQWQIQAAALRKMAQSVLSDYLQRADFDITVIVIETDEMTRLNETFLNHSGSTDVITFDYSGESGGNGLQGEIYISMEDAARQAKLFRTTAALELARYTIHGLLHLAGHDDKNAADRRAMKRHENKLVKDLSQRFDCGKLAWKKHGSQSK